MAILFSTYAIINYTKGVFGLSSQKPLRSF